MVFSSISFLFFFLPLLLICYYVSPKKYRNYVLLLFSLFFYYMGEKWYVILLLGTCFVNYIFGLLIEKNKRKIFLISGILFHIIILFYFKYINFFLESFSVVFQIQTPVLNVILPLGISFFTFQNISYLIDVYRKDAKREHNFFQYATYITLFPQLVAGPIVRYKDVNEELECREENITLFSEGVTKFVIGLSKKVLIADTIYHMYQSILASNMAAFSYFLVALGFSLQIYYDFSGYSDMAIGLGKMFGFHLKENFQYPFIASSITDFWRRWHISLSSFFKDYVYIPLGGNRCSVIKNIRNIFIVWFLTGLWHGANWNFILWGMYFFVFLILEKFILKKYLKNGVFSHVYACIVILISFVIFSIPDIHQIILFLKRMLGIGIPLFNKESIYFFSNYVLVLAIALMGVGPYFKNKIAILRKGKLRKVIVGGEIIYFVILFLLTIASIVSSSFNPFIYFRF